MNLFGWENESIELPYQKDYRVNLPRSVRKPYTQNATQSETKQTKQKQKNKRTQHQSTSLLIKCDGFPPAFQKPTVLKYFSLSVPQSLPQQHPTTSDPSLPAPSPQSKLIDHRLKTRLCSTKRTRDFCHFLMK